MVTIYPDSASVPALDSLRNYTLLGMSIHQMIFNTPARSTVGEWLKSIDIVYARHRNQPVLILTDATLSLLPPLAHAVHLSRLWSLDQNYGLRSRNAILHLHPLEPVADDLLHAFPGYGHNLVRF